MDRLRSGRRAELDAQAAAAEAGGPDTGSGIGHLRFHDLRGTAATNFARADPRVEDIAMILAWGKGKVEQIAVRYVTGEAIAEGMVQRLRQNKASMEAVNQCVNQSPLESALSG